MRMSVSSTTPSGGGPGPLPRIQSEVARHVSQLMQLAGVRGLFVERSQTPWGQASSLGAVLLFDGVPAPVAGVSRAMACSLATVMASFGISDMVLSEEPGDRDALSAMWNGLSSDVPDDEGGLSVDVDVGTGQGGASNG